MNRSSLISASAVFTFALLLTPLIAGSAIGSGNPPAGSDVPGPGPVDAGAPLPDGDLADLTGPNVVRYPDDPTVFKVSSLKIYTGVLDPKAGCRIRGQLTADEAHPMVAAVEVAFDPDSCRSLVREGDLVKFTELDTSGESLTEGVVEDSQRVISNVDGADAATSRAGTFRATASSYYEDPARADVNKVTNRVTWRTNGSCIQWAEAYYRLYWLRDTGWRLAHHDWSSPTRCGYAQSTSRAVFENKPFCDPRKSTYTYYSPNTVTAYYYGRAIHTWEASKNGDCASRLHFKHEMSQGRR